MRLETSRSRLGLQLPNTHAELDDALDCNADLFTIMQDTAESQIAVTEHEAQAWGRPRPFYNLRWYDSETIEQSPAIIASNFVGWIHLLQDRFQIPYENFIGQILNEPQIQAEHPGRAGIWDDKAAWIRHALWELECHGHIRNADSNIRMGAVWASPGHNEDQPWKVYDYRERRDVSGRGVYTISPGYYRLVADELPSEWREGCPEETCVAFELPEVRQLVAQAAVMGAHHYWDRGTAGMPYGLNDANAPWYWQRFKSYHAHFPDKPIFIGEANDNKGVDNELTRARYIDEVIWATRELYKYPYIIGQTFFIWCKGTTHPNMYHPDMARALGSTDFPRVTFEWPQGTPVPVPIPEPIPVPTPAPMPTPMPTPIPIPPIIVEDRLSNTIKDLAWLKDTFGTIVHQLPVNSAGWRVIEIYTQEGPANCDIWATPNTPVAWYWPDAPTAVVGPTPELNKAEIKATGPDGKAGYGLYFGSYIPVPYSQGGPHAVWIADGRPTEWVTGIGMQAGTNHYAPNIAFAYFEAQEEPTTVVTQYGNARWIASPNFWPGRTKPISKLVMHYTAGSLAGTIARFTAPDEAASHYVNDRDGSWLQFVVEENAAWHVNAEDVNQYTIGVEVASSLAEPPTQAQYMALSMFVRAMSQRYGIPIDRDHVTIHRDYMATQCPGHLNIEMVIAMAQTDPNLEYQLRNQAWNNLYQVTPEQPIAFVPDNALQRAAGERGYGLPTTREFYPIVSGIQYVEQGFQGKILYCRAGDYGNVLELNWH